jgi:hypothetical protein
MDFISISGDKMMPRIIYHTAVAGIAERAEAVVLRAPEVRDLFSCL